MPARIRLRALDTRPPYCRCAAVSGLRYPDERARPSTGYPPKNWRLLAAVWFAAWFAFDEFVVLADGREAAFDLLFVVDDAPVLPLMLP